MDLLCYYFMHTTLKYSVGKKMSFVRLVQLVASIRQWVHTTLWGSLVRDIIVIIILGMLELRH